MHKWSDNLYLFTPEEFEKLPDGTILTSVGNNRAVKGIDNIGMDTRSGLLAWGVRPPLMKHPLAELFIVFKLTQ